MAKRRTREQWAVLIGAFERSSKTVAQFCGAKGIAPNTFRWWQWQLRSTAAPARRSERVQMVPVAVTAERASNGGAVVIGVCGVELRVEVGADIAYVTALVASLRARC